MCLSHFQDDCCIVLVDQVVLQGVPLHHHILTCIMERVLAVWVSVDWIENTFHYATCIPVSVLLPFQMLMRSRGTTMMVKTFTCK